MNDELKKSYRRGLEYEELDTKEKSVRDCYEEKSNNGVKMALAGMGMLITGLGINVAANKEDEENLI